MPTTSFVTVVVSDPWGFPDENEGRYAFLASIAGDANGYWLLRLLQPITFEGHVWHFAIPITRHAGQRYFDDPCETDDSANIILITNDQAELPGLLRSFDRMKAIPGSSFVVGSVKDGICPPIRDGETAYVWPDWHPPDQHGDSSP